MARVALLDDYQGVALSMADWKSLPPGTEVASYSDSLIMAGFIDAHVVGIFRFGAEERAVCRQREVGEHGGSREVGDAVLSHLGD